MKRYICMILALLLMTVLCSCSTTEKQFKAPVTYYYRAADTEYGPNVSIIKAEVRETKGYSEDYRQLITQYLNGPRSNDCISPFPAGTTLEEFNLDANKVQVMLSPHLALLSGAELMVACACLTSTLTQMTGVDTVQISAENGLLNNEESITLTDDSFAFFDIDSDYS